MTGLIERIRQIIERHRADDGACSCGAKELSHHSGHLANEIVERLGLRQERVNNKIRYVSAWFDEELTILEGAE